VALESWRGHVHWLSHLGATWTIRRRRYGWVDALGAVASSIRSLTHLREFGRLFRLDVFDRYIGRRLEVEALFAVSHKHFLSNGLDMAGRVRCAHAHFFFEDKHTTGAYREAVYGGSGIELWSATVDGHCYSIVLRGMQDLPQEGPLSVVLTCDAKPLHILSFAWVPASLLISDGDPGWLLFVARNQSLKSAPAEAKAFQAAFPQNTPSYFCMAAVFGIAQAHRQHRVAGIAERCQIAFESKYAVGFRNSYSEFWGKFGAREASPQVYLMSVPPQLPPLSSVAARHRARARARRAHWNEISERSIGLLARQVEAHHVAPPLPPIKLIDRCRIVWPGNWLPAILTILPA
jgi:uncharacterized protein VirK/YbjX